MIRSNNDLPADGRLAPSVNGPTRAARGPLAAVLDLFSSVWFGIFLLFLLFCYTAIDGITLFVYWGLGLDGGPLIRTLPGIELTEFEWFHWWPFNLLIALLAATIAITTVRRIPLEKINLGVWMIHTGILTLLAGSVWYFGTKVEGDAPVYRRRAVIQVPGVAEPASLVIRPGNVIAVGERANVYQFRVSRIIPEWPILSGDDKGQKTYAVLLDVQTPTQNFTRQLLAGYPQYTEDILASGVRAKKETGMPLVDEALQIALDYEPQDYFYLQDSAALYIRRLGEEEWVERPITRPARYNEYAARDDIWLPAEEPLPLHQIDRNVPAVADNDPLKNVPIHVTGYLPHADESTRWFDGDGPLNPVIVARLQVDDNPEQPIELIAFDARRSRDRDGAMVFRWVESSEELEALAAATARATGRAPSLSITIPGTDIRLDHPIAAVAAGGEKLGFTAVPGTDYSFRVQNVANDLTIPAGELAGQEVSVAIVEVRSPKGNFTRWVADRKHVTKDFSEGTDPAGHASIPLDKGLVINYDPGQARVRDGEAILTLVAGPGEVGIHALLTSETGARERYRLSAGETVAMAGRQLKLTLDKVLAHARAETRPEVVAKSRRDRDVRHLQMLQVALDDGGATRSLWLRYNPYPFQSRQYGYPGRMMYDPQEVRLADGKTYELMFSRRRMKLPYPVALEDFKLDEHVGGFTGSALTIRNYVCRLRFTDGQGWTDPMTIQVNHPTEFGGYWYFQSQWDPPSPQMGSAGFNYTGLGVGNRNGVYVQLAGCAIAVAGMIYAFYVKPIIKARRRAAVQAGLAEQRAGRPREKMAARELAPTGAQRD